MTRPVPGYAGEPARKPLIRLDDASLYGFGHFIRLTEQLILNLFNRGLLSGATHTCLGQELCQMSVVRALSDADDVVLSNRLTYGHLLTYPGHAVYPWLTHLPAGGPGNWRRASYKRRWSKGLPAVELRLSDGNLCYSNFCRLSNHLLVRGLVSTHGERRFF